MFSAEDLHPKSDRLRHALLLAALHNGPLTRRDKRVWSFSEFLDDPWAQPAAKPKLTASQLTAQVASINTSRRGRRGH